MPTKRFVWKDRDTATLDLIQLAYHAPQHISQQALDLLSAIRSNVIVPDLREITLDSEREYWERVYALRALANAPGDIYFPELIAVADQDLLHRQQVIAQWENAPARLAEIHFYNDMIREIVTFAAKHPVNGSWLFDRLDQADPLVRCNLLSEQLPFHRPQEMSIALLHRLIALLEANPTLFNLYSIYDIYSYGDGDEQAQAFLNAHFNATVELAIAASPSRDRELHWAIPFEWPELKAAIFRLRPDIEDKFLRDEAQHTAERDKLGERYREDFSYQETAIWRELEVLYERAESGNNEAFWGLCHKTYDDKLSIPTRAAATHFFGKLRIRADIVENLAFLVRQPCDMWEGYSPVRFEAGIALFDMGTPKAWEALVAAYFVSPTNMLENYLSDWIECLTDKLSGVATVYPGNDLEIENQWFKVLSTEARP